MFINTIKPLWSRQQIKYQWHPKRLLWEWVNMMFNKPDEERIKKFGPDRTCAEWVLRNSGKVVIDIGQIERVENYNSLPPEETPFKIVEIDGTASSISYYGFPHLFGCKFLKQLKLNDSKYIDDRALKDIYYCKESLEHLQVSKCYDVSDDGLKEIKIMKKLKTLILFDLDGVKNIEECKRFLKSQIPNCKINTS